MSGRLTLVDWLLNRWLDTEGVHWIAEITGY
jgi:hypothetical protein